MKKIKNSRTFTFKAYAVTVPQEALTDVNKYQEFVKNVKETNFNKHFGTFTFKSDCEYYVEKNLLDTINNSSPESRNVNLYLIYKISTVEDSDVKDMLIMSIYFNGEVVVMD